MQNVDKLRNLVRYQSAPRVSSETVAEHSFFVAAYVLKLHDYYDFKLEKALSMAILHDYAEAFISDVPSPIKQQFPNIAIALEDAEHKIISDHISKDFANYMDEFNDKLSAEGCMVALADILSVVSYAKYEIGLGNSEYMKDVLRNAKNKINKLVAISNKYIRTDIKAYVVECDNIYGFINNIPDNI